MNDRWSLLLRALDITFGSPDISTSRLKTQKQTFDNQRQEHQVHLVYAYKRSGAVPSIRREFKKRTAGHEKAKEAREKVMQQRKQQTYDLLRKINNNVGNPIL